VEEEELEKQEELEKIFVQKIQELEEDIINL
jgi:hypothetical protein